MEAGVPEGSAVSHVPPSDPNGDQEAKQGSGNRRHPERGRLAAASPHPLVLHGVPGFQTVPFVKKSRNPECGSHGALLPLVRMSFHVFCFVIRILKIGISQGEGSGSECSAPALSMKGMHPYSHLQE